jgi:hypothetical protein
LFGERRNGNFSSAKSSQADIELASGCGGMRSFERFYGA